MNNLSCTVALFLMLMGPILAQTGSVTGGLTPFGLQSSVVTALAAESMENGIPGPSFNIFAGTQGEGVFRADPFDPSGTWKSLELKNRSITALGVQHWGVGPRDGLTLFAAALPGTAVKDSDLIYRREEGFLPDTVWTPADSGIDKSSLTRINAIDAFYYTGHQPPERRLAGGERGLYSGTILLWTDAIPGLDAKINDIDVAPHWPAGSNAAWAAGQRGVMPAAFRSVDRGVSWIPFWLPAMIEGEAYSVACNPRSLDSVFVGGTNAVWITGDSGKSWGTSSLGTPGVHIQALAVDPILPGNVYAGGADFQNNFWFFHSTDGGNSWRRLIPPVNTPLNGVSSILALNTLAPEYRPKIFIATLGKGVWLYDPFAATSVTNDPASVPAPGVEIYPQPCGPGAGGGRADATFRITLPPGDSGNLLITIHDSFGRILDEIRPAESGSAVTEVRWAPRAAASGVYVIRICTGTSRLVRTFLYLHR